MQGDRRALRALGVALYALALAGPACGAEATASARPDVPSATVSMDETVRPGEAIAHLGSVALRSEEPEAAAGGVGALRTELDRLRLENEALRTDVRSTERLVGAGLLAGGMLLGALLRAAAGRRPQPRIRF